MRIGLDLLYLLPGLVGGTETYARGLLAGLARVGRAHDYVVFTNREAAEWPLPDGPFTRVVCPVDASARHARYAFEQLRLPLWAREREIDVLHAPGYVAPLAWTGPLVVTIPDVNTIAFGVRLAPAKRLALSAFTRWSAHRAGRVLTISEFSRREIVRHLGVPAAKVEVTLLAAEPRPLVSPGSSGNPYLVAFSSASPNKNVPRLLEAYALARERHGLRHELVLIGHPPSRPIAPAAGVRFTGWLSDAERDAALSGADLLVFPSLYEGFGLPVLEAMAAGVPVLSSNRASLPEVGGDAAEYFDPENVEELARKIAALASDRGARERMREAGLRNAARFSWEETAEATLRAYEEAVRSARRPGLQVVNQGGGPMFRDLVAALPAAFRRVDYYTSDPEPAPPGVVVHRSAPLAAFGPARKAGRWLMFLARTAAGLLAPTRAKRVLLVTNPPLTPALGLLARAIRGSRYVLLYYDVYPKALTALTSLAERSLVVRLWHALNRWAIARAAAVVTISPDLAAEVGRYVDPVRGPSRVHVVSTWADNERVRPIPKGENPFAVRHGQVGVMTVLYAGNLGAVHDLTLLPALADALKDDRNVRFLVVGDGAGLPALKRDLARRGSGNVTLLPSQPEADLPLLLATGDVAIVSLARGAEGVSMPSKTYWAMAAGSALFGLSRPGSDLARVIESADCGVNADSADPEAAAEALRALLADRPALARRRANARHEAQTRYARDAGVTRLVALLKDALA